MAFTEVGTNGENGFFLGCFGWYGAKNGLSILVFLVSSCENNGVGVGWALEGVRVGRA